jgi:activator of HSP90 ATPase
MAASEGGHDRRRSNCTTTNFSREYTDAQHSDTVSAGEIFASLRGTKSNQPTMQNGETLMASNIHPEKSKNMPARRHVLAGTAAATLGGVVASARRAAAQTTAAEVPAAEADGARTSLHQEVEFAVAPQRIYDIFLTSGLFTAFSSETAEISPDAGGAFSLFGARIVGRNIELVPGQRIVQAWRPAHWNPGVYSIVKFEFMKSPAGTMAVLDHTGFPPGDFASLSSGWNEHYWQRLRKYLT